MKKNKKIKKSKIQEFKELIILIIVALTVKTCLIEIYVVPTGSMENTILIGDMLIGNKFVYGMKIPDWIGVPYTRFGVNIPIYKRLPKFKDIEQGDVVIFEFPRDPFQKYVKRCIGLPGDVVSIGSGKESEFIYNINDTTKISKGDIVVNDSIYGFKGDGQFLEKYSQLDFPYMGEISALNQIFTYSLKDSSNLYKYDYRYSPNAEIWTRKKIPEGIGDYYIGRKYDERNIYTLFSAELFDEINNIYEESELYIDFNKNNKFDTVEFFFNMDSFKDEFYNPEYDINFNGKWDYGNEDNIQKFTVPYKGQQIDFNNIKADYKGNWKHIIYMLLLEKNDVTIKYYDSDSTMVKYTLIVESAEETARLKGILKFELSKIFARLTGGDLNKVLLNRQEEIRQNAEQLKAKDISNYKINPWQLNQFVDSEQSKTYLQISNLANPLSFNELDKSSIKIDPLKHVYINNISLEQYSRNNGLYKLKYDYYFMVGDNSNNSSDSRFWGFVPEYHILGSPIITLINLGKIKPRFKIIK